MHWPRSRDPNNFVCLLKSRCGTADMVPGVAADNCDQALLANDGIADRHDPARFCARTSCGAFFQVRESNKSAEAVAIV